MADAAFDAGQIHIWRLDLDRLYPEKWQETLSEAELRRAERFVQQKHSDRFLQGRASLRMLLSAYSGRSPKELELEAGPHGKPRLLSGDRLGFNMSHSDNLAIIALGRGAEIGIDIERFVPPKDPLGLAEHVFSEDECCSLADLPAADKTLAFLTGWTRKEAFLKALGVGFSRDPRGITVGLLPERSVIMDALHGAEVTVTTIQADSEAVISLALVGPLSSPQIRRFTLD